MVGEAYAYATGLRLKGVCGFLAEASQLPDHQRGVAMRIVLCWIIAILVGFTVTYGAKKALEYAIEAPEIRDYVPGEPVFKRPMTENLAKVIIKQLNEKLDREGIRKRFADEHPIQAPFVDLIVLLLDPIGLLIFILTTLGTFWLAKRKMPKKLPDLI